MNIHEQAQWALSVCCANHWFIEALSEKGEDSGYIVYLEDPAYCEKELQFTSRKLIDATNLAAIAHEELFGLEVKIK